MAPYNKEVFSELDSYHMTAAGEGHIVHLHVLPYTCACTGTAVTHTTSERYDFSFCIKCTCQTKTCSKGDKTCNSYRRVKTCSNGEQRVCIDDDDVTLGQGLSIPRHGSNHICQPWLSSSPPHTACRQSINLGSPVQYMI